MTIQRIHPILFGVAYVLMIVILLVHARCQAGTGRPRPVAPCHCHCPACDCPDRCDHFLPRPHVPQPLPPQLERKLCGCTGPCRHVILTPRPAK